MCTIEEYNAIPLGEIFRVVTTKYHNVEHRNPELTFVCRKSEGHPDWAITYHYSDKGVAWIAENGEKVRSTENILSIFPCTDEVLKLYRL